MVAQNSAYNTLSHKQLISLQNYIIIKKNYVMALHKKVAFLRVGVAIKTDIEKNEMDIQAYESLDKIAVTEKKIEQAEITFENRLNEFIYDVEDIKDNFDAYLELAKKHQSEDIELKHLLYSANWKSINENIEEKIVFYKSLRYAISQYLQQKKK